MDHLHAQPSRPTAPGLDLIQRERHVVVTSPLGDLADVAAGRDQDRDEVVPQPVEGDPWQTRPLGRRLPHSPREQ
jgi:hypothetical protein